MHRMLADESSDVPGPGSLNIKVLPSNEAIAAGFVDDANKECQSIREDGPASCTCADPVE